MIIRIGFIGVGFTGQVAHLDNYVRVPECEVRGLCDLRPKLLEAVAAKYRIPKTYQDHKEMLKDPKLDAVICCQPPAGTYTLARDVLKARKHLMTQCPMATQLKDAQELVELAEKHDRVFAVGCMKRFDMGVERARQELNRLYETGGLGALLRVDARCFCGDWVNEIRPPIDFPDEPVQPPPEIRYPDFLKEEWKPAYTEYLRIYSHNINLIRYLLPEGELKFVHAVLAQPSGILSHTTSFRWKDVPVSLVGTYSNAHEWQETTQFIFEKGRVLIRTPTPLRMQASASLEIYSSDGHEGEQISFHNPRLWAFMLQAAGFAGAVAGIGAFRSPGKDCLNDLRLVEEVFKKAKYI